MKITAEIVATELIDKKDEEEDGLLKISCEGFEASEVILEFPDGRKFKVDADDILEAVSRAALERPAHKQNEED